MARPVTLIWPARDLVYICNAQTVSLENPNLTITTNGLPFASSGVAQNAFDTNPQTACEQTAVNGNIGYNWSGAHTITKVGIISNVTRDYDLIFEYSADGTNWTTAENPIGKTYNQGAVQWSSMSTPGAGSYFRIRETGGAILSIQELYFNESAPFPFNGTLYQQQQQKGLTITSVPFQDVARDVSLSAGVNVSGVTFTVSGVLNGVPITESIAGPNNNTVSTTNIFDSITGISVNKDVNSGVDIGTGLLGRTKYFLYNYQSTFPMLMINVFAGDVDPEAFSYSFGFTLDEVNGNLTPQHIFPADILFNKTDSAYDYCEFPIRYAFIEINAGTDNATITTTFLQQGIQ